MEFIFDLYLGNPEANSYEFKRNGTDVYIIIGFLRLVL